jgi:DNA-binding NtrC family response regulator
MKKSILILSEDPKTVHTIRNCFDANYNLDQVTTLNSCLDQYARIQYEFLFIDISFLLHQSEEKNFKEHLQLFWRIQTETEIIVLTPPDQIRDAVKAVKAGASNYLTLPIDPAEVKFVLDDIRKDIRIHAELKYLRDFWQKESQVVRKTHSPMMKDVFDKVRAVAPTNTTVLLTGETGTGKGVLANLIHQHSQRSGKQFISVHCGALSETLLESELFGHEKGAFTGSIRKKLGKFEIAHGGSIFLDEIGTISPAMQIKLLQVLQDRTFQRVGGETEIQVDVRILVATNADLKSMCEAGSFRQDLFYRLNVFPIEVPSLRERIEDIPVLVDTFLERLNKFSTKHIQGVAPDVLKALQSYNWPGNIRELENIIERAYVLENHSVLTSDNFPNELSATHATMKTSFIDSSLPLVSVRKKAVSRVEREYLTELLKQNQGKINATAEAAGIGVRQLHKLMQKYGLHKEDFKG